MLAVDIIVSNLSHFSWMETNVMMDFRRGRVHQIIAGPSSSTMASCYLKSLLQIDDQVVEIK